MFEKIKYRLLGSNLHGGSMKKYLALFLSILSFSAFSSEGYKLDMNVLLDGKVVSRPKIIVEKGKKAILTQEDSKSKMMTEISIVVTEGEVQGSKGILLNLEIMHKEGEARKVIARPQVLISEGKEALFETANNDGTNKMELKVIATRTNL
jgi:hypothetical protein